MSIVYQARLGCGSAAAAAAAAAADERQFSIRSIRTQTPCARAGIFVARVFNCVVISRRSRDRPALA